MKSNFKIYIFLIIQLVLFTLAENIFAQDFSKIELKTTQVRNNIYMLEGVNGFSGGNIGVSIGKDGILIIDDQLAPMSKKIDKALLSLHPGKLKFVLNTHWHGDHTGGNAYFSKHANIIAHDNVRKRLMQDQKNLFGASPAKPKQAWPIITFDTSLSIHFNDEEIKFLHLPNGHTDGDGVVFFTKNNVIHLGDHFFNGVFPFVDLTTGGNVFGLTENIKKIIDTAEKDVIIIPGHGPLAKLEDLKTYYSMLVETGNYVKNRAAAGKPLSEIQAEGLPKKWKSWANGFINEDNWILFIYQSLNN